MMVVQPLIYLWCVCLLWSFLSLPLPAADGVSVPPTVMQSDSKTYYFGILSRGEEFESLTILARKQTSVRIISACGLTTQEDSKTFELNCSALQPTGNQLAGKGIQIVTSNDARLHVTIIAGGTKESTLIFDENGWGMEFIVITLCDLGGFCQFSVVATEDDTSVLVTFPSSVDTDSVCINGENGRTAGESVPFTMDKLDLLHIESETDLSGTLITSNKNVAVFAGARNVPSRIAGTTAHFIEQLIPRNKFGTDFYFVPNNLNPSGDIMKLVTSVDNTRIEVTGHSSLVQPTQRTIFQTRIDRSYYTRITANHPVIVAQFMSVDLYNDTNGVSGSPAMVLVPSVQHFTRTHYVICDGVQQLAWTAFVRKTSDSIAAYPPIYDVESGESSAVPWSDYMVLVKDSYDNFLGPLLVSGTSPVGGYFFCGNDSAALGGINLQNINEIQQTRGNRRTCPQLPPWTNDPGTDKLEVCVPTHMSPADEVDNDCDGKVDEDICTKDQFEVAMRFEEHVSSPPAYSLRGDNEIMFQFKSCGIGVFVFGEEAPSLRKYVVQVSSKFAQVSYHDETGREIEKTTLDMTTSDMKCTDSLDVRMDWLSTNGLFYLEIGTYFITWLIPPKLSLAEPLELVYFYASNALGSGTISFVTQRTDCGQVPSGYEDVYGTTFVLAPWTGVSIMTTPRTATANCKVILQKYPDKPTTVSDFRIYDNETVTQDNLLVPDSLYLLKCDKEVTVYMRSTGNPMQTSGFIVLPTDVLGVKYILVTAPNTATKCSVVSLNKKTTVTVSSRIAVNANRGPELQPYSTMILTATVDMTGTIVTATRPVAVFCSSTASSPFGMEQMPPVKTLGRTFLVPALNYSETISSLLWVIASEDSTYLTIAGDFDEEQMLAYKGDKHTRRVDDQYSYEVIANKAAIVAVLVTAGTSKLLTIIPPVEQYDTTCLLPEFKDIVETISKQVSEFGIVTEGFEEMGNLVGPQRLVSGGEKLGCLMHVTLKNSKFLMMHGGTMLKQINMVCETDSGTAGDKVDNDCDGLTDEEVCPTVKTAGLVDADIDGDIDEDCSTGQMTPVVTTLSLSEARPNCSATFKTAASQVSGQDTTMDASLNVAVPFATDSFVNYPSPPTIKPPIVAISPQSQGYTTDSPTTATVPPLPHPRLCDCICPCAWAILRNVSQEEIRRKLTEFHDELTVDKKTLGKQLRRKISADDNRPSAVSIGYVGILFLVLAVGFLVVLDLSTLVHDLQVLVHNVRVIIRR